MKSFNLLVVCLLFAVSAEAQGNCMAITPSLVGDYKHNTAFWMPKSDGTGKSSGSWSLICSFSWQSCTSFFASKK